MITIDELRKNATHKPGRSGTGYIKLKANIDGKYCAYRFYNNEFYPRSLDQIHTHGSTFHSITLKGTLRNIIYEIEPTDESTQYYQTQGACASVAFKDHKLIHENVTANITNEFTTSENEDYTLESHIFHRIAFDTPAVITLITPIKRAAIEPYYIINREVGNLDPWDHNLSANYCWEVIRYCLDN